MPNTHKNSTAPFVKLTGCTYKQGTAPFTKLTGCTYKQGTAPFDKLTGCTYKQGTAPFDKLTGCPQGKRAGYLTRGPWPVFWKRFGPPTKQNTTRVFIPTAKRTGYSNIEQALINFTTQQ